MQARPERRAREKNLPSTGALQPTIAVYSRLAASISRAIQSSFGECRLPVVEAAFKSAIYIAIATKLPVLLCCAGVGFHS